QAGERGKVADGRELVVARAAADHQGLGRADVQVQVAGVDVRPSAVRRDGEAIGAAAAVDERGVVAVAAFEDQRGSAGLRDGSGQDVVPAQAIDDELVGRLGVQHGGRRGQPYHRGRRAAAGELHRVVAAGAVDDDLVNGAIAGAAARGPSQVHVHLLHVSTTQIVNAHDVRAAQRIEVDALDAVQIHGHVGDVAREERALPVRLDIDLFGDVGAVEEHG